MRVWQTGVPRESVLTRLMLTDSNGYTTEPEEYEVVNGRLKITLPSTSAVVLKGKQKEENDKKDSESKHISPLQRIEYLLH